MPRLLSIGTRAPDLNSMKGFVFECDTIISESSNVSFERIVRLLFGMYFAGNLKFSPWGSNLKQIQPTPDTSALPEVRETELAVHWMVSNSSSLPEEKTFAQVSTSSPLGVVVVQLRIQQRRKAHTIGKQWIRSEGSIRNFLIFGILLLLLIVARCLFGLCDGL